MANLTKEILLQTEKRTVIKLTYDGLAAAAAGGLTATILPSDMNNYLGGASGTNSADKINLDIGKAYWCIPSGGANPPPAFAVAWGVSGSLTGQDSFYMSNYGHFEGNQLGFVFKNPITGSNRTNAINVRNTAPCVTGNSSTIILELNKTTGFGSPGVVW